MFDHHFLLTSESAKAVRQTASACSDGFCVMLEADEKPKIKLPKGIEASMGVVCEFDFATDYALAMRTAGIPYDYAVNRVTSVDGISLSSMEYYTSLSRNDAYAKYLDKVFDSLDAAFDYSVLAPIGYVSSYAYYPFPLLLYREFPEALDSLLMRVIYLGKGLEVDASAISVFNEPIPSKSILRRYRELGGEIITVGSYSSTPKNLENAYKILSECGFTYYTVFKSKTPQMLKL